VQHRFAVGFNFRSSKKEATDTLFVLRHANCDLFEPLPEMEKPRADGQLVKLHWESILLKQFTGSILKRTRVFIISLQTLALEEIIV